MSRLVTRILANALALSACRQGEPANRGPEYSARSMSALRWLDGTWRDSGSSGNTYYEVYRFESDSFIRIRYYSDVTLAEARDSSSIYIRAGAIYHETPMGRWRATHLDSLGIRFDAVDEAGRSFVWRRETPTSWTATMATSGRTTAVFRLERVP